MTNKILVTYASRTGSTAEVAEAIARTLSEGGAQVDVLPMQEVKDLTSYQGIVVAAPSASRSGCRRRYSSSGLTRLRSCISHLPCSRSASPSQ